MVYFDIEKWEGLWELVNGIITSVLAEIEGMGTPEKVTWLQDEIYAYSQFGGLKATVYVHVLNSILAEYQAELDSVLLKNGGGEKC